MLILLPTTSQLINGMLSRASWTGSLQAGIRINAARVVCFDPDSTALVGGVQNGQ